MITLKCSCGKYTWENKSYSLNETTGEIIENVEGTFSQYPIRLAWAVTVHKSQGLTFEKAILDLSGGLLRQGRFMLHFPGYDLSRD